MARKWCGMPLWISSWGQGGQQEARLDAVPVQSPQGYLVHAPGWGLPMPCMRLRALQSLCTADGVHTA